MLTGDKVQTVICIEVSSRLAKRSKGICKITGLKTRKEAKCALPWFCRQEDTDVPVFDGTSLQIFLDMFQEKFIELAGMAPAAVACHCSPTQKATIVRILQTQEQMEKRVAAIGGGRNGVGIIQSLHELIGVSLQVTVLTYKKGPVCLKTHGISDGKWVMVLMQSLYIWTEESASYEAY